MRWFPRARAFRFPADMLARLELLGRHQLDPHSSGIDSDEIWSTCVAPFWEVTQTDRDSFLADLYALIEGHETGFATFGASRLVWELLGGDALHIPAAWPLIDAGIEFKRARGLVALHLTGYEQQHLARRRER